MKKNQLAVNFGNLNFQHLQSTMLSKHGSYILKNESSPNPVSTDVAEEIFDEITSEMLRLGYIMSIDLKLSLAKLSEESLIEEAKSLIHTLSVAKGDLNNFVTLQKHFPRKPDESYREMRMLSILSYMFGIETNPDLLQVKLPCGCPNQLFDLSLFNACPICQQQFESISDNVEGVKQGTLEFSVNDNIVKMTRVGLADKKDLLEVFSNLLASSTSITSCDKEFIKQVLFLLGEEALECLPVKFEYKEQLCLVTGVISESLPDAVNLMKSKFKTYTDVLRLAAYLSGFDVSLYASDKIKFKLARKHRKLIMTLLDKEMPMEDMIRRRGLFLALGRYLHVSVECDKYPKAAEAFNVLRNNHKSIITFNSKKEALLMKAKGVEQTPKGTIPKATALHPLGDIPIKLGDVLNDEQREKLTTACKPKPDSYTKAFSLLDRSKAFTALVNLLSARPGAFAEIIDEMLRVADTLGSTYIDLVINAFEKHVVRELKILKLFKLRAYFAGRVVNEGYRSFIPKGDRANLFYIDEDKRETLSQESVSRITLCLLAEISKRLSSKESLGNVYIDPQLKNIALPSSMRSMASSLTQYPRGSRIPIESDAEILRMFMYWKGGVDFDLSAKALDENWNIVGDIGYWTSKFGQAKSSWANFSEDIRSAPNGAAECIDIDVSECIGDGIRYVVMFVNIFNGKTFQDYNAFAGVMERTDGNVGHLFEPSSVSQKINLVGDAKGCIPLILDVVKREYIICDMSTSTNANGLNSCTESLKIINLAKITEGMIRTHPTMYDLAIAHALARGKRIVLNDEPIEGIDDNQFIMDDIDFRFDMSFAMKLDTVMGKWLVD